MALLKTIGLTKDFGALRVLDHVDLEVREGSLHSVVGPNGAGKTTLFNLICGFVKPSEGRVEFKGKDISHLPSHQMAHLGIRRSFQVITLFLELTALENVRLAIQAKEKERFSFFKRASDLKESVAKSYEILHALGLDGKAEHKASELSHGEQRLLDIGVAMAGESNLLLLDEPTSGLVYDEIPVMGDTIKKLTPKHTVVLIEHRVDMVLSISDTITVLDFGRVIAQGPPDIIRNSEEVSRAYLGVR
ncbi:MAG: ABC transporter ATP-binding protein [Thermodesulfobacteriota bacterium]|nr:ABC transporter ATP-binding protein [Thermodesulfobacteriota bacterium]